MRSQKQNYRKSFQWSHTESVLFTVACPKSNLKINHPYTTSNVRHALLSYFDETSSGISLAGEKIKSEYFFLQSKKNGNLRTTDFDLDLEINNKAPHQLLFIMRMIHQP